MKKDGYFTPNRYIWKLVSISRTWNADGELIDVEEKWEDGGKVHSDTMVLQQYYRRGNDRWRLIERVEHEQRARTGGPTDEI